MGNSYQYKLEDLCSRNKWHWPRYFSVGTKPNFCSYDMKVAGLSFRGDECSSEEEAKENVAKKALDFFGES
ncbi:hypothetical protein OnM2_089046 [Erysiphe neolycopersici]|uniref:DRBM domain-containing protein n=1 Tax=Erysiphe neolycopersici TaxID=212602 RepID=A0A420HD97_9PEZI|nr:hypothetical protein OnM2_089046 [Erysiphe neolycopersici]